MHVLSWSVLAVASMLLLSHSRLDRFAVAGLAVAIGFATALLWEVGEYLVWVRSSPELASTEYADATGDVICGLAASGLAVGLTLVCITRRREHRPEQPAAGDGVESIPSGLAAT